MTRQSWLTLALTGALGFALAASGCTAALRDVVGEGRALLRDHAADQVEDAEWQTRRATYLADADAVAPEGS